MLRITAFILLAMILGVGFYMMSNAKYIRTRRIVEIRKDAIVVQGQNPYDPACVLPFEEESRFYDAKGNKIALSEIKTGDHVMVK